MSFLIGQFSLLWIDQQQRLNFNVDVIESEWGRGADLDALASKLAADWSHSIKAVCIVHNETATGVTNNLATVRKLLGMYKNFRQINSPIIDFHYIYFPMSYLSIYALDATFFSHELEFSHILLTCLFLSFCPICDHIVSFFDGLYYADAIALPLQMSTIILHYYLWMEFHLYVLLTSAWMNGELMLL